MEIRALRQTLLVLLILAAGGLINFYDTEAGICVFVFALMTEVFFTSIYGEALSIGMWFERRTSPRMYYFLQTLNVSVLAVGVIVLYLEMV